MCKQLNCLFQEIFDVKVNSAWKQQEVMTFGYPAPRHCGQGGLCGGQGQSATCGGRNRRWTRTAWQIPLSPPMIGGPSRGQKSSCLQTAWPSSKNVQVTWFKLWSVRILKKKHVNIRTWMVQAVVFSIFRALICAPLLSTHTESELISEPFVPNRGLVALMWRKYLHLSASLQNKLLIKVWTQF